jgi:integrase
MLAMADTFKETNKPLSYFYKDEKGQEQHKDIVVNYAMVKALVCILYLFGKRISEILEVRRKDVWTRKNSSDEMNGLYIRFTILKKTSRTAQLMPVTKVKHINIRKQRTFAYPIIEYVNSLHDPNMPLFFGQTRPHKKIVKRKDSKTGELKKVYEYSLEYEGTMSAVRAYQILKALNPEAYPHWFRHSLATQLAEEGHTPWELKDWFDWSRFETATHYVEGTASMTRAISNRVVE